MAQNGQINRIPGLEPGDPAIAAGIERATLVTAPETVAEVLVLLGERMRGEWDLIMFAVPAGKSGQVLDAVGMPR